MSLQDIEQQITALTPAEMLELQKKLEAQYVIRYQRTLEEIYNKFIALTEEAGVKLEDVLAAGGQRKHRVRAIKFKHPEDPELVWSGVGKKPHWVNAWIDKGGSLDQLSV